MISRGVTKTVLRDPPRQIRSRNLYKRIVQVVHLTAILLLALVGRHESQVLLFRDCIFTFVDNLDVAAPVTFFALRPPATDRLSGGVRAHN